MNIKTTRYRQPRKTFSWKSHSYGKFALCLLFFYGEEVYNKTICGDLRSSNFYNWLEYTFPSIFHYYKQKQGIELKSSLLYQRYDKMCIYENENPNNSLNKDYEEMSYYYSEIKKRYNEGTRIFHLPIFEEINKKMNKYLGKIS